jgi:hypothetical protein
MGQTLKIGKDRTKAINLLGSVSLDRSFMRNPFLNKRRIVTDMKAKIYMTPEEEMIILDEMCREEM